MFPAGLGSQISTWVCKSTTRPTVNQVILPRISRECSMWNTPTPSFCMWNSQNWIEYPGPLFKNTLILKRCLYYNHLPQPISAAHRKRKYYKRSPWKRSNSESNQNQDPNADDYDKYHSKPWQRNEETATKTKNATGPAAVAKTEAEAAEEEKIVKLKSLVSPDFLLAWNCWELGSPNSYVTKALLKLSNLSDLSKARRRLDRWYIPRAATSKSIPKHLIGQDKNKSSNVFQNDASIWAMQTSNLFWLRLFWKKSRQQLTICWRTIWNMAYWFNSWNVWCCKKMHCKFDIHQFIDRTYLRNKVRHIGFLPTALWKTNT